MRKDIADEIKTECDNRGDYSQCLKHMSQESLDTYLDNLGFIESIFNSEISHYAIDFTNDLIDESSNGLVRVFWFSRGMDDFYLCITGDGFIKTHEENFPQNLLHQIAGILWECQQVME